MIHHKLITNQHSPCVFIKVHSKTLCYMPLHTEKLLPPPTPPHDACVLDQPALASTDYVYSILCKLAMLFWKLTWQNYKWFV